MENTTEDKTQTTPATNNPATQGRQEGVKYEANQGVQHSKEKIEEQEGYYDEFGFYILPDGDFYDHNGYYFDKEGYDEFGG